MLVAGGRGALPVLTAARLAAAASSPIADIGHLGQQPGAESRTLHHQPDLVVGEHGPEYRVQPPLPHPQPANQMGQQNMSC